MILIIRRLKIRSYQLKLYYLIYMLNNRYWKKTKLYKKISNIYYKKSKQKKKIPFKSNEKPFFLTRPTHTISNIFLKRYNLISYLSSSLNIIEPVIFKNNYYSYLNVKKSEILIGKVEKKKKLKEYYKINRIKEVYFKKMKENLIKNFYKSAKNITNSYTFLESKYSVTLKKLNLLGKNYKLLRFSFKFLSYENIFYNKILKNIFKPKSKQSKLNQKIMDFFKKLKNKVKSKANKNFNRKIFWLKFNHRFKISKEGQKFVKNLIWRKKKRFNLKKIIMNVMLKYTKKLYKINIVGLKNFFFKKI